MDVLAGNVLLRPPDQRPPDQSAKCFLDCSFRRYYNSGIPASSSCHRLGSNSTLRFAMKDPYDILRQKEMELVRLRKEVEALRMIVPLLAEEHPAQENPMSASRNKWPLDVGED